MPSDFVARLVSQAMSSYNARWAPAEEVTRRGNDNGSVAPNPVPYDAGFRYSEGDASGSLGESLGGSVNAEANPLAGTRLWDWMSD